MTPEQKREEFKKFVHNRDTIVTRLKKEIKEDKIRTSNDPIYALFGYPQEDPTDEEDEPLVVTDELMLDAGYTPRPKLRDRHEDHIGEIHKAMYWESLDNPQAK